VAFLVDPSSEPSRLLQTVPDFAIYEQHLAVHFLRKCETSWRIWNVWREPLGPLRSSKSLKMKRSACFCLHIYIYIHRKVFIFIYIYTCVFFFIMIFFPFPGFHRIQMSFAGRLADQL